MRIAMIGQKGPALYGGIERHVEELAAELAASNHNVVVYARSWYTPKTVRLHRGFNVVHTPGIHTKHLDAITHTFTATIHAITHNFDIIHYHGVGPALLSFIPRLLAPKARVIVTFHCVDRYHQKWNWLARTILYWGEWAACHFPDRTIAVSKGIKTYCLNEHNTNPEYIPNGARFVADTNPTLLAKYDLTSGQYVTMISRLVRHKGAHDLIDAWKKMREDNPDLNNYKLVIAGGSANTDDYVSEIKAQAKDESSIVFLGWVKGQELDALFGHATMLVHPSYNEGLPLTVLTAMSAGIPVLVSNIPEHRELIDDNRFVFEPGDTTTLADKMAEIINNPKLAAQARKQNAVKAKTDYDWIDIRRQTEKIYLAETNKVAELKAAVME